MFPFRDHNPSARTPYVTLGLIAANLLVFVLMLPFYGNDRAIYDIYNTYALVPAEFTAGYDRWTILTSMFMHAGFWHIFGNMLFLWVFGDNLEDRLGHVLFLGFYLGTGALADLAQVMADPTSRIATVGASGAIAGVLGGYLLLFPKAQVDVLVIIVFILRVVTLPAWFILGVWFAMQLLGGFGDPGTEGGVAYWAHAGGFLSGLVLVAPLWLWLGGPRYWDRTQGRPPHPGRIPTATRIPVVRRRR